MLARRGFLTGLTAMAFPPVEALAQLTRENRNLPWITPAVSGRGVSFATFDSEAASAPVSYHLYRPPQYEREPERSFPTTYWLHGSGGGLTGIPVLAALFDHAIRTGHAPPMIVVFPHSRGESMWCDARDGSSPVETVLVRDLIAHVDATFRTIANRSGRLIAGFSMGGYGAARLGFTHRSIFGAVSMLGAGPMQLDFDKGPRANRSLRRHVLKTVYGNDPDLFRAKSPWRIVERDAAALQALPIHVAVGDRDPMLPANREFHDHLGRLEIAHEFDVVPGVGHQSMALIEALGDRMWAFYRCAFAFTPAPSEAVPRDE